MAPLRLGLLRDFPEEGWPSMDLAAEMLCHHLRQDHLHRCAPELICPPFRRRFSRLPWIGRRAVGMNADRLLNRFWEFPRYLSKRVRDFDLFHVVDHSYAQLVHELPPEQTGVFCHDLDAFRCLFDPRSPPRPRWFRALTRRILRGLQKAAVVFYSTMAVRREIEQHGIFDPARLIAAPYGPASEFTPHNDDTPDLPPGVPAEPFFLHVGSCIPRKRIDVLLDVFAAVRRHHPELRLVKVGGAWTGGQLEQIDRLGLADAVTLLAGLGRSQIAALYRRGALVLLPSEAEGFGLPVIEALACGAVVVASDIPPLREVGGDAAVYCPVGDLGVWSETVVRLLSDPSTAPSREARLSQASRFSCAAHARTILDAYLRLCPA
jgi:glycosyltransferase involved in cell wall biosynthesis